ncbi:MAG: RNase adapter RapZ [Candidatus Cellulosilyticum pullistercoris]|uniref:RNase adapter RapZ n=1 Tax=Candidatus Cellulosilyticum pullistercoris TaxID=2838521 RepID=A0A9E2NMB8_9FIRM|nr:RNase adapter RapZ [Candidatus Cellulosilyticum pullistercoris]
MNFIIVTGMSGAGKSSAINFFEDMGYYCVDNLPPILIKSFADLIVAQENKVSKVVLGIDTRGGSLFADLFNSLQELVESGHTYEIIFFDCSDTELIKRYKETRRLHPLARSERVEEGIVREREILKEIKEKAHHIIDTSYLLPKDTRGVLYKIYCEEKSFDSMMITIVSFGFKYGIPIDADLVFDVRFAPNPYYIQEMRPFTGNESIVSDYVMQFEVTQEFLAKLQDMVSFLIPNYKKEGKNQLVVAIGCTGGKHRSVTLANALYDFLQKKGHTVIKQHRDIEKDSKRGK